MLTLGTFNRLIVKKQVKFGFYLDGEAWGDILLPNNTAPQGLQIGQALDVFLYLDSEDQLIATTEQPLVTVGQVAYLAVVATTKVGAFLDWGLKKDLLVPFSEQRIPLRVGQKYLVYCYVDRSNRIVASTKLDKFLDKTPAPYQKDEQVSIMISEQTDLGYKAVINHQHWGVLYKNEVFKPLQRGDKLTAVISKIRDDSKIDLRLPPNTSQPTQLIICEQIIKALQQAQGSLALSDNSSPEVIQQTFGISKKAFKQAIGRLYKEQRILVETDKITLL